MPTLPKLARHDWAAQQLAAKANTADLGTAATTDATDYATAARGAYPVQQVTLTGNLAYTLPVDAPADQVISVVFTQDATGGHTVTYDDQPVTVDLAAGATTQIELRPTGSGWAVAYPPPVTGLVIFRDTLGNLLPAGTVTITVDTSTLEIADILYTAGA